MRRWIFSGALLLAVAALLAAALANFNGYLNRNKDWLEARAESVLARDVSFSRIGVSLAGGFGVRVDDLTIADDPAFSGQPVVQADSALVRVRLLPALAGRYEIARVVLEQPVVNAVRTQAGLNLSALGRSPAETGPAGEDTAGKDAAGAAAFVIAALDIENGSLRYADHSSAEPLAMAVESIDFTASDVRADAPVSFTLAAAAFGAPSQNVKVKGVIGPLPRNPQHDLPLDVVVEVEDLSTDNLARVPEIASRLPAGLVTSGPISLVANVAGLASSADIEGSLVADRARVRYGTAFDKPPEGRLRVELKARRRDTNVSVDSARVLVHNAELRAKGEIATGGAYDLTLTSDAFGLRGWNELLPALAGRSLEGTLALNVRAQRNGAEAPPDLRGTIDLADVAIRGADVPTLAGLTAAIVLDGKGARLAPTPFSFGGSPVQISAEIADFAAPAIAFTLAADTIAPDALADPTDASRSGNVLRASSMKGIVTSTNAGPKMAADLASASGTLGGIDFRNLAAHLRTEGARVYLEPLSFAAFGGTVRASGTYDRSNPQQPSFELETKAQAIRLGEAAVALGGDASRAVDGNVDADLSLSGNGRDWQTISRVLTGDGRIAIRDGVLKDVNVVDGVLKGITGVPGLSGVLAPDVKQKYPRLFGTGDTLFEALEGSFRITDGALLSDDLVIRAAEFVVEGDAAFGFDRFVDMDAVVALSPPLSRELVAHTGVTRFLSDPQGSIRIPFTLEGRLPGARPHPDLGFIAHAVQRAAVEGYVGAIIDREKLRGVIPKKEEKPDAEDAEGDAAKKDEEEAKPGGAPRPSITSDPPAGEPQTAPAKPMTTEERYRKGLEALFGR